MTSPNPELEQACKDYGRYIRAIFEPAMVRLKANINAGHVELHQVFGANLFVAHAVDYIQAIRNADGIKESRTDLVRKFDQTFSVNGARFSNRKFELIDAINNALKHIRLDPKRYRQLEQQYGPVSFQSLVEEKGRVLCILDGYRFDYARVVLRPAYQALADWDLDAVEDVLEFARGEVASSDWTHEDALMASDDPADAPDQMIAYCNPTCDDCGEGEPDCYCAEFVYEGEQGRFESRFQADFNFDEVMSRISGAYRRDRD
ncbi:hypothetical protein AB4142_06255 [Variovorax sp. 2RAF20]